MICSCNLGLCWPFRLQLIFSGSVTLGFDEMSRIVFTIRVDGGTTRTNIFVLSLATFCTYALIKGLCLKNATIRKHSIFGRRLGVIVTIFCPMIKLCALAFPDESSCGSEDEACRQPQFVSRSGSLYYWCGRKEWIKTQTSSRIDRGAASADILLI